MAEPAAADDEVLLGLGGDITKVQNRTYRAYQRLRNFACVCPLRQTKILVCLKADPKEADPEPSSPGTYGLCHGGFILPLLL
jgi:predicted transport protein